MKQKQPEWQVITKPVAWNPNKANEPTKFQSHLESDDLRVWADPRTTPDFAVNALEKKVRKIMEVAALFIEQRDAERAKKAEGNE